MSDLNLILAEAQLRRAILAAADVLLAKPGFSDVRVEIENKLHRNISWVLVSLLYQTDNLSPLTQEKYVLLPPSDQTQMQQERAVLEGWNHYPDLSSAALREKLLDLVERKILHELVTRELVRDIWLSQIARYQDLINGLNNTSIGGTPKKKEDLAAAVADLAREISKIRDALVLWEASGTGIQSPSAKTIKDIGKIGDRVKEATGKNAQASALVDLIGDALGLAATGAGAAGGGVV